MKAARSDDPVSVLVEDVSSLKKNLVGAMRHGSDAVADRASAAMSRATDSAKAVADKARDRATDMYESVGEFASERPMVTIAIAAVAGAVLLHMLTARSRR